MKKNLLPLVFLSACAGSIFSSGDKKSAPPAPTDQNLSDVHNVPPTPRAQEASTNPTYEIPSLDDHDVPPPPNPSISTKKPKQVAAAESQPTARHGRKITLVKTYELLRSLVPGEWDNDTNDKMDKRQYSFEISTSKTETSKGKPVVIVDIFTNADQSKPIKTLKGLMADSADQTLDPKKAIFFIVDSEKYPGAEHFKFKLVLKDGKWAGWVQHERKDKTALDYPLSEQQNSNLAIIVNPKPKKSGH